MKESYHSHGEPLPVAPAKKEYSGQFNVRIDRCVHRALAVEAAQAGISLNALVAQKLSMAAKASARYTWSQQGDLYTKLGHKVRFSENRSP